MTSKNKKNIKEKINMTTEELKYELESLGLRLCNYNKKFSYYTIEDENWNIIARVSYKYLYSVEISDFYGNSEKQEKLFNVLTKYAMTPIEERTSKRYFKYKLKSFADNLCENEYVFLNYLINKNRWFLGDGRKGNICQVIFEENDPLLELVHLEMFEAIEVDKEGNEL